MLIRSFAFADTAAAKAHAGGNDWHAWMGLRFQDQPGGAPNDFIVHVDLLAAIRKLGLVSDLGPFHRLADYLAKRNVERTGIVLGLPLLRELFHESHYRDLGGGILEAFGRLFIRRRTAPIAITPPPRAARTKEDGSGTAATRNPVEP